MSVQDALSRLIGLFGPQASWDPTKLYGNLMVSPAGNVVIGTTTDAGTSYKFQVTGNSLINGGLYVASSTFAANLAAYYAFTSGGEGSSGPYPAASVSGLGVYCPTTRVVSLEFDAISDRRAKRDIKEMSDSACLDFVERAKSYEYRWKHLPEGAVRFGFMAQDIAKLGFPNLLKLTPDEGLEATIDEDGFESPKDIRFAVEYDQVIPIHTSVLRQLLARVCALESQVAALAGGN
ncbi:tail fiber domain-containing protein [Paraburkholderia sp. BCC1886]|uniref:tail fiber domain-containing protein n=1 Tax=Paraburkholderia sp. BCC1886 TaxID=2562670 RepID=UPI0016435046|nr:tail fiber domain-containing protein [Paraburkholderia sp. BCC1886]